MSFLDDILNALKKAPEDVQKRVASGELPIDAASLAQRQADQLNPEQLYHWTGQEFSEFKPSSGGKYGPGIYLSPRKYYGEKYVDRGTPQRMDVKSKGQIAEFKDIAAVEPEARRILQEIEPEGYNFGNTYWTLIGDELQKKGFTGLRMDDEVVVFDPRNVKANTSVLDPEYKGANIFGALSGLTAGGLGLGAALQSEDAEAGIKDVFVKKADDAVTDAYRGSHMAPDADYGGPINDLGQIMPEDVYGSMGERYYGIGDKQVDKETFAAVRKAQGNPDAEIDVYRAVPKGVEDMFIGDWVTPSKRYAEMHGDNALRGEYDILKSKVPAKKLQSEGLPYEYGILPAVGAMAMGLNSNDAMAMESGMPMAMQAAGQSDLTGVANPGRDFGNIAAGVDMLLPLFMESIKPATMGNAELTEEQRKRGYYYGM